MCYDAYVYAVQVYRHSFRPLIYLFSKQIETVESVKLAMVALQLVAMKFFKERLRPAVNISDHSDGLRTGMQTINEDEAEAEEEGEEEEKTNTPHLSDWAHVAVHFMQGRILPKANPYFGQCWFYMQAIHFAHSKEMMELLISKTRYVLRILTNVR
jgi:hypothetical protein